jgi:hypothetical protein
MWHDTLNNHLPLSLGASPKGNHMLYEYDDGHASFECYLLAEHIEDDSRSYVELLPEYVERGERSKYWINNEYLSEGE